MTSPSLPLQNHSINYRALFICFLLGGVLWFYPRPPTIMLEDKAWHILTIFIVTILGLILKPLPMGGTALIAMVIAILTKTITLDMALSGFSNETVWLVVFALFIANGFSTTGLGKRIAYYFTALLGKNSLGLAYGMLMTDLILAPAIPSVTGIMVAKAQIPQVISGIAHWFLRAWVLVIICKIGFAAIAVKNKEEVMAHPWKETTVRKPPIFLEDWLNGRL